MSPQDSPVAEEELTIVATGSGGEEQERTKLDEVSPSDTAHNTAVGDRINTLRSRFGEAFLPYALRLESVGEKKIKSNRKGRRKRFITQTVNKAPKYKNDERHEQYDNTKSMNSKKVNDKKERLKRKEDFESSKLSWHGDTMTFEEGWPNIDRRQTMRIFHINLNGISHYNKYLEWEMTLAFLMDMQVDIFGLTEVNLDMANGEVKDNFIQCGKHFDAYMRLSTLSSLQKVGESPFKMGGTVTGTNGCWSGRLKKQGSDILGRWSYLSLEARYGTLISLRCTYHVNPLPMEEELQYITKWRRIYSIKREN